MHTWREHGGGKEIGSCRFCGFSDIMAKVYAHELSCTTQSFYCDTCNKKLLNQATFYQHKKSKKHLQRAAAQKNVVFVPVAMAAPQQVAFAPQPQPPPQPPQPQPLQLPLPPSARSASTSRRKDSSMSFNSNARNNPLARADDAANFADSSRREHDVVSSTATSSTSLLGGGGTSARGFAETRARRGRRSGDGDDFEVDAPKAGDYALASTSTAPTGGGDGVGDRDRAAALYGSGVQDGGRGFGFGRVAQGDVKATSPMASSSSSRTQARIVDDDDVDERRFSADERDRMSNNAELIDLDDQNEFECGAALGFEDDWGGDDFDPGGGDDASMRSSAPRAGVSPWHSAPGGAGIAMPPWGGMRPMSFGFAAGSTFGGAPVPMSSNAVLARHTTLRAALEHPCLKDLICSAPWQMKFWESSNMVGDRATAATRNARGGSSITLLLAYVTYLEQQHANLADVASDVAKLRSETDYVIGATLLAALVRSSVSADDGSPSAFLRHASDGHDAMTRLLKRVGLSKSRAHQAFAMTSGVLRWLVDCYDTQLNVDRTALVPYALQREQVHAFAELFQRSLQSLARPMTRYKNETRKRRLRATADTTKLATDEFVDQFMALYGDLLYHVENDAKQLAADFLAGSVDAAAAASSAWNMIAVMLAGVGMFSFRKGVFVNDEHHSFVVARSVAAFTAARGNPSGIVRVEVAGAGEGHSVFDCRVRVCAGSRQKEWIIGEFVSVPAFANRVLNIIISQNLLGNEHTMTAPIGLSSDGALKELQRKHRLIVPLQLARGPSDEDEDAASINRQILEQQVELVQRSKRVRKSQAQALLVNAAQASAASPRGDGDDGAGGGNGSDSEHIDDVPARAIDNAPLTHVVVRRLAATLQQYLYMVHAVDALQLCCATYMDLHSLPVAHDSYNKLHSMFVELDSRASTRWKLAAGTWNRFLADERRDGPKTFNSLVTDGLGGLVKKAHAVHDALARHAHYHSLCFPEKPCPDCGMSLATRPQPHLHGHIQNRIETIMAMQRLEDDE
jgi:hypothetical protein